MATGKPGTKPYVIGVTIESVSNLKLMPEKRIGLTARSSSGYVENLQILSEGQSQFVIADSVATDAAISGKSPFPAAGVDRELKGVAVLWQEVDHFLIASDRAQSGTITDLVALTSNEIAAGPDTHDAAQALLTTFGLQSENGETLPLLEGPGQLDALNNGAVTGLVVSRPASSDDLAQILDALGDRAQLLEFTGRQLNQLGQGWLRHPIPASAYATLSYDIDTVARSIMMLVDASVDDDDVYEITRTMFENLPFLASIDQAAALINLDDALDGMTLSLHPGAARYYQEVGLLPPGSVDPEDALSNLASVPSETGTTPLETPGGNGEATLIANTPPQQSAEAPDTLNPLPSFVLDDAMLNRSRGEFHDGTEILKIDRPDDIDRPGTEIVNVYFDLGDTKPNPEGAARAQAIAQSILQQYRTSNSVPEVYVEGHTDRSGDWQINFEIAHNRAVAVKEIMVEAGVPGDWIQISDHSEQKLAVPTEDGVSDWRNRRAEIAVIPRETALEQSDAAAQ